MTDMPSVEDIQRRTRRSISEDGLTELGAGMALLVVATVMFIAVVFDRKLFFYASIFPALVMISIRSLRVRLTAPRIGYAEPARTGMKLGILIGLAGLMVLGVAVTAARQLLSWRPPVWAFNWLFALLGLGGAAALYGHWRETGLRRFFVYAAVVAASSVGPALARLELGIHIAVATGASGLVMTAAGIWWLVDFLRRHPRPAESPAG
ncbi:MAG: hypothetical protein R6X13_12520 [bacterium]